MKHDAVDACFVCCWGKLNSGLEATYQRYELLNLQSAPASANREYRLMVPKHYLPEDKASGKTWPLVI